MNPARASKQLMKSEFTNRQTPSADAKAEGTKKSLPHASVVSLVSCAVSGVLFVSVMHFANFAVETVVLMLASSVLLLLSIIVGFLKLRTIVPMFTLFPFCLVVAIRHVGDMGKMHFIDGGLYLFTVLIFFCSLAIASAAKYGMAKHRRR